MTKSKNWQSEHYCTLENFVKKMKREDTDYDTFAKKIIFDEGLQSKTFNELSMLNKKSKN